MDRIQRRERRVDGLGAAGQRGASVSPAPLQPSRLRDPTLLSPRLRPPPPSLAGVKAEDEISNILQRLRDAEAHAEAAATQLRSDLRQVGGGSCCCGGLGVRPCQSVA